MPVSTHSPTQMERSKRRSRANSDLSDRIKKFFSNIQNCPGTDRVQTILDPNNRCFHERGNYIYIGTPRSRLSGYPLKRISPKLGKSELEVQNTISSSRDRYQEKDPFVILHVITIDQELLNKFNCQTVRQLEEKIRSELSFSRDFDFDGDEYWYNYEAFELIDKVKEYLFGGENYETYGPRIPQQRASDKMIKAFSDPMVKSFLFGAIMRFGKNFTFLWTVTEILKNNPTAKILVFTNKPGVFKTLKAEIDGDRSINKGKHIKFKDLIYLNLKDQKDIQSLPDKCVVTVSKQLLENNENQNLLSFVENQEWDFIIIDEAHSGIETPNGQSFLNKFNNTKKIFMTGTPQKQLGKIQFNDNNTFIYDETDQKKDYDDGIWSDALILQTKLIRFSESHIEDYKSFVSDKTGYFSFVKFFQCIGKKLVYSSRIKQIFEKFFGYDERDDSYNFFGNHNHLLILLPPGIDAIKDLKSLLDSSKLGSDYEIIAATGEKFKRTQLDRALTDGKKTITLTSQMLIEGETVPEWEAAINMSDGESIFMYNQFAFRPTNPDVKNPNKTPYFYDLNPQRHFVIQWTRATLKGLKGFDRDEYLRNYYKNFNIFYGSEVQNFIPATFDALKKEFYERGNMESSIDFLFNWNNIDINTLKSDLENLDGTSTSNVEVTVSDHGLSEGENYSKDSNQESGTETENKDDATQKIKQKLINIFTVMPYILYRLELDSVESLLKKDKEDPTFFSDFFSIPSQTFEKYWNNQKFMDKTDMEYYLKNFVDNMKNS